MKKFTTINSIAFVLLMLVSISASAQKFSGLDKSPMDNAAYPTSYKEANKEIKIYYSRPQLKGRSLSKLAPNGEVWRTGANESPELVLYKEFTFGDTKLKPGSYSLFAIPGEKEWIIIINKDLNAWGSYFYKEGNDVARIKVPVTQSGESLEAFSIAMEGTDNGVTMHMGWDTVRVAVPFMK